MTSKKLIRPGEKVPLNLNDAERTLVLEEVNFVDEEYLDAVRRTPPGQPVMVTLDELDDFGGYIAAEANHTTDKKLQKKWMSFFRRCRGLLDKYTDEEPAKTVNIEDARKAKAHPRAATNQRGALGGNQLHRHFNGHSQELRAVPRAVVERNSAIKDVARKYSRLLFDGHIDYCLNPVL